MSTSELKNILLARDWPEKRAYVRDVLAHRSKVLRDLAAAWLGSRGEAVLDDLAPVLNHSNADARLAAVEVLKRIGGPRAATLLRVRLDNERSAKVRRAILNITGATTENAPSQEAALLAEAEATLRRVAAALPEGLDLATFPLRWASGAPLPEAVARFLIYRQSRAKPDQLDTRIASALALIDRSGTGELALALWTLFLEYPLLRIAARSLIWVLDTPDGETNPKPTFLPKAKLPPSRMLRTQSRYRYLGGRKARP
ncbi:MAG: hypothetical protein OHK0022_13730 [Roseiflexaceae bacterium]